MTFIKKYKYILLSLVCLLLTFEVNRLAFMVDNKGSSTFEVYSVYALVPILAALGVFFAVRSKNLKESKWASTVLQVISILSLIVILFYYIMLATLILTCAHSGGGSCV
jgi:hypothetical protein